jgi:PAS domain S-box-containing protein
MSGPPDHPFELRLLNKAAGWASNRLPAHVRPYVAALAVLGFVISAAVLFLHAGLHPSPLTRIVAGLISAVYLLALMGAAWKGYGPGIAACLLTSFIVPYFLPRRNGLHFDPVRLLLLLLVSLLISRLGQIQRRREEELREAAGLLEARVRERTEEAERAAAEARQAAEELREQAQLLDMAHDAILSLDWNGAIRFWNRGAEKMYGWTRAEAIGKDAHELLKTGFPESREAIERHLAAKGRWEGELTHTHRDGRQLKVASRWALLRDEDGQPQGFLEIASDITERRRMEEQLRHTQKLESLGVLAGGIAHDFNNLLTGILGNSSLALDNMPIHHPSRCLIGEAMRAAERAADLTRQLLAYAGKGRFVMRTLDLSELVIEIGRLVQSSFPKHVQLRLEPGRNLPGVDADPGQIQQIVMNLALNGAEAIGQEGGSVLIRTTLENLDQRHIATLSAPGEPLKPGPYVCLEVQDTGCGMDEQTVGKIFDPFFTTKFAGRGLGLSAVQGIVRAHKGALKVYSRPRQGTTFQVLFPASQYPIIESTPSAAADLSGRGTVLVVDDEEIVRAVAAKTLRQYGYHALEAVDGADAVEVYGAHAQSIALVLLDLTMPQMSGEDTLRRLQTLNPGVKVVLTSGYNEAEAIQRFAGKGLAGFIQKPYTAAALAAKVKEALDGASSYT